MPELPDVEDYKRYLDATALHQTISGVAVQRDDILENVSKADLQHSLKGHSLESTRRHGKYLFVALDDGEWLTMHFGMTGALKYFKDMDKDPAHDRLRIDFDNGYHLALQSQRMLAGVGIVGDPEAFLREKSLGPDALAPDLDEDAFCETVSAKRGQIKSALMDQSLVAGIGNVYSDEILFQAGLHPKTDVKKLDRSSLKSLYKAMRNVLETTANAKPHEDGFFDRLPSSYLLPHRQEGAACPRCQGRVEAIKAAGRTGYFCPRCQEH